MKICNICIKLVLVSLPVLVLCLLALYAATNFFIMPGFQKVENRSAINDAKRGVGALDNRLTQLDRKARDWGTWDASYAFVKDHNKQFIATNLDNQSLANLGIDYMLFFNADHQLVEMKHVQIDAPDLPSEPLDTGMQALLAPNSLLLDHATATDVHKGVIILPEGIMMLVSRPILASQATGPIRGSIVFAQLLDAPAQQELADLTQLKLTYLPTSDAIVSNSVPTYPDKTSKGTQWVSLLTATRAQAFTIIPDIYGKPSLAVRVDLERTISQQGSSSTGIFVLFALLIGLLFIITTTLLIYQLVVNRILVMSRQLVDIKDVQQSDHTVAVTGNDELTRLGVAINDLLVRLHNTYDLRKANASLEQKVDERAKALDDQLDQMKRINGLMVGRELRMKELKQQNAKLRARLGDD